MTTHNREVVKEEYLMVIFQKFSPILHKKTHVVGTHQKHLTEALLMSTHNIIIYYGEK